MSRESEFLKSIAYWQSEIATRRPMMGLSPQEALEYRQERLATRQKELKGFLGKSPAEKAKIEAKFREIQAEEAEIEAEAREERYEEASMPQSGLQKLIEDISTADVFERAKQLPFKAKLPDPRQPVGKVLLDLGKFRGEVYTNLLRSAPGPAAEVLGDIDKILSRAEEAIRMVVAKMPQP